MSTTLPEKAVILARGLGTRMRKAAGPSGLDAQQAAVADTGVKALIPIDRPFLDYVMSALADAGYRRVCLVIGPDHDAIRRYYGQECKLERISVDFAVQQEPRGTADAVLAAEAFSAGDPFVMLNSDNYYPVEALAALRSEPTSGVALFDWQSMISGSNLSEERLRSFSVGRLDGDRLAGILEKPDEATWNALPRPIWISMNCWQFRANIFDACKAIQPSKRGEYELPDAVEHAMRALGEPFRAVTVRAPVLDMTCREDIAGVAKRLAGTKVRL